MPIHPNDRPDKAHRILPQNAVAGVVNLNSNITEYIDVLNPKTAGEEIIDVECTSIEDVAEKFKPEIDIDLNFINNLGEKEMTTSSAEATIKYGEDSKNILNNFTANHIMMKTNVETDDSGKANPLLFDQQIEFLTLEDMYKNLIRSKDFKDLYENNKQALLDFLESEVERIKSISEEDVDEFTI